MQVYINGRFLVQRITGVQRFAREIIKMLDHQLDIKCTILVPSEFQGWDSFQNIKIKKIGKLSGHLWEQLELPLYVKGRPLINLCNTGPVFKRNQIITIHDAAVYASPQGFSKLFRVWYKTMFFFFRLLSRKILTVSEFSKNELVKYLKVNSDKLKTISEGKEHFDKIKEDDSILPKMKLKKNCYILAVSSMNPNKNFQTLVETTQYLKDESFEIVIAGGTDCRVFNRVNLTNENIKHAGYVTDEELKSLYMHAGCFVFPSVYEGFGLPPLEAMSVGCPILVSNVGPMPEVAGEAAVYFNPYDSKDLAQKIKYVMNNDEVKNKLKEAGLKQADKFSWKTVATQLIGHIKQLDL
ncbi:glycosyltransferase family 1 protein [Siminovitchia acidinfaciens]|uniref:Glycosyltransferase family 1 protein n=1 Tax=Siminovitchia acidinfaciens TaxID=2321395 RepID=A0A429XZF3_9BACI|nr:glycosyltransferase family 1 protein [Siminovitchia acidinfaciens]RST74168.1 glycosyltransferase family 1 protein [Siminovitchia acidinfaciens]